MNKDEQEIRMAEQENYTDTKEAAPAETQMISEPEINEPEETKEAVPEMTEETQESQEPEEATPLEPAGQPAAETKDQPRTVGKRPTVTQLEQELGREEDRHKFGRVLRSTIYVLVIVAAVAVLIATLVLPVLKIYGNSMTPTLEEGEIVVALKRSSFETGDIIAFYYNNRILVKRVICGSGDWFDMDEDGNVYVNGERIDEPYVKELSFETCDLELPYQVPDGLWFVMGDHRATSVDSRSSVVGCVGGDQIVGKIFLNVWPLDRFRIIKHK